LGKIGDRTTAVAVAGLLMDPSPLVRSAAAKAVGRLGHNVVKDVVPKLLRALNDPYSEVGFAAAAAIAELEPEPELLSSIPELLASPQAGVRRAAMLAVAEIDAVAWLSALQKAVQDADPAVRQGAVAVLGESSIPTADRWLRERLLTDPDAGVRAEAAYRLRALSDNETRGALLRAADTDVSPTVRLWARQG
jgi:HEAT repeat protein